MKDGAGNIAFRSTNANNWLTPTLAQYYQIGGFNSPVAFTAQGGTTMGQSQFASSKFQITAGTYNLAALPTKNFEMVNSADLLKFSIDDSGSVVAKGRLSTDSTLHTLGITQVPVFDSTNYKPDVVDAAGKHFKSYWPTAVGNLATTNLTSAGNRTFDLNFSTLAFIQGANSTLSFNPTSGISYLQATLSSNTGLYLASDSLNIKQTSGRIRISNLIGQHNAGDSMVVYNPSTRDLGMREIPAGGGLASSNFVYNEEFTGSTSSTYILANTPVADKLVVFKNGIKLPNSEFSLSGTTVTLTSARLSSDIFSNDYIK